MTASQGQRAAYFLRTAKKIAEEVQFSQKRKDFDRVVRKTQEAVELYLKGNVLQKGIEPAKTHDLRDLADLIPEFTTPVPIEDLIYLSEERIPSFYGGADFIPDQVYESSDGDRCLEILKAFGLL